MNGCQPVLELYQTRRNRFSNASSKQRNLPLERILVVVETNIFSITNILEENIIVNLAHEPFVKGKKEGKHQSHREYRVQASIVGCVAKGRWSDCPSLLDFPSTADGFERLESCCRDSINLANSAFDRGSIFSTLLHHRGGSLSPYLRGPRVDRYAR